MHPCIRPKRGATQPLSVFNYIILKKKIGKIQGGNGGTRLYWQKAAYFFLKNLLLLPNERPPFTLKTLLKIILVMI